jgi:hypothetical protein
MRRAERGYCAKSIDRCQRYRARDGNVHNDHRLEGVDRRAVDLPVMIAAITAVVRVVMCAWRALEIKNDQITGSLRRWLRVFLSCHPDADLGRDFFVPTVTGTMELAVYPVLIALGTLQPIGWWLALKTAVQWNRWKERNRVSYNRFIVGNALVLTASVALTHWIKI